MEDAPITSGELKFDNNQINVSNRKSQVFYVYLGKMILEKFDTVVFNALGNAQSISVIAAEKLVANGYADYVTLETKTIEVEETRRRRGGGFSEEKARTVKRAKLFITLKRSDTFGENMKKFKEIKEENELYIKEERAERETLKVQETIVTMKADWEKIKFRFYSPKSLDLQLWGDDTCKRVKQTLDDQLQKCKQMKESEYVGAMYDDYEAWEVELTKAADTFEMYEQVKKSASYLAPIVNLQKFAKEFPKETDDVKEANVVFNSTMTKAKTNPVAWTVLSDKDLLPTLKKVNETHESIKKTLDAYITKKKGQNESYAEMSDDMLMAALFE